MYNDVLVLLSSTQTTDDTGELVTTTTSREVFAKLLSIGQQEFYQAQANGLKPELKFELADYEDYADEKEAVYNGLKYQVLRTYRKGIRLELTLYGGTNNAAT